MSKEQQTKLETYLNQFPKKACCGSPVMHIAQQVYIKCSKCGFPLTKGIPLSVASTIQNKQP